MLAKRVQRVFVPSKYVKQKVMRRFGIENVIVTPNGVNRSFFYPDAIQKGLDLPKCYILFVGSLAPRKNLNLLLRVWGDIKSDFKEIRLIIVGVSGNVFGSVHFSNDLEQVRFLGYVEDEVLAGLYASATVFVLPSQDEGFGLTALEAMASGVPVIVSDGGALPEIVGEAGLIFYLSNPLSLENALRECLSNTKLRSELKQKGLLRAEQFSWKKTAELVWKNLNEL
jgi:glycosyltransferase involved in cell wall biosynthesis